MPKVKANDITMSYDHQGTVASELGRITAPTQITVRARRYGDLYSLRGWAEAWHTRLRAADL